MVFCNNLAVVTCRTGSLEIHANAIGGQSTVTCRTGSLEIKPWQLRAWLQVTCRTGSLEKIGNS